MANMSYCRMENTYRDLYDCYLNMDNVSSESEKRYKRKIIELCQDIIDQSEEEDDEDFDEMDDESE